MKKLLIVASTLVVMATLYACGGGGGSAVNSSSQTYTAGAQIGELVSFSVDTAKLAYSYVITKSAFGCEVSNSTCNTGSGTLTLSSDGSYSPSQFPVSKIQILQNGLMFGAIQIPVNGSNKTVPVVGMKSPVTTISELAESGGTIMNWVQYSCQTPSTNCWTSLGTVQISQDGSWSSCAGYNLADSAGVGLYSGNASNCVLNNGSNNGKRMDGVFVPNGDGTWKINYTQSGVTYTGGTFIAFKDPSTGQRVAIFDLNDSNLHGLGYGSIVASTQSSMSIADGVGTWLVNGIKGNSGNTDVVASGAGGWSFSGSHTLSDQSIHTSSGTISPNSPWTGVAKKDGSQQYFIMGGTGLYASIDTDTNNIYIETGYKK